jgi:hypothetical protein
VIVVINTTTCVTEYASTEVKVAHLVNHFKEKFSLLSQNYDLSRHLTISGKTVINGYSELATGVKTEHFQLPLSTFSKSLLMR